MALQLFGNGQHDFYQNRNHKVTIATVTVTVTVIMTVTVAVTVAVAMTMVVAVVMAIAFTIAVVRDLSRCCSLGAVSTSHDYGRCCIRPWSILEMWLWP